MKKFKNFIVDHIDSILETVTTGAVLGFGAICFALGKFDI